MLCLNGRMLLHKRRSGRRYAGEKGPSCRPVALALRYLELQHENGDPQTQNPDLQGAIGRVQPSKFGPLKGDAEPGANRG